MKKIKKKKPAKKPKRKTSARKPPKPKLDPQKLLRDKINRIKARVPEIEPTGEVIDESTGEVLFRYTEAQHVFKVYREQCDMEGLTWRPYADAHIQPKITAVGSMTALIGFYCIEDKTTGAKVIGWGSGMGGNRDWSANTAGTRTLKQFLLTVFEATWEDPEDPLMTKDRIREEVIRELEADGTLAQIEQLRFWSENLGKPKKGVKNVTDSRKPDTKDRRRANSKKTRTGAKRDNRRSKKV